LLILIFAALGLVLGQFASADPAAITQAKQEAAALRQRIDDLANELDAAIEDYDYAVAMLDETQAASDRTQILLTQAQADLAQADAQLVDRLVEIYKEGQMGFIDTLLGSASFSEVVSRLDFMERMSGQDAQIVADVQAYTDQKSTLADQLAQQLHDQQALTGELETARVKVEQKLAANQAALVDKKDEIAQLVKEEAQRQAQLLAEAKKAAEEAARKAAALVALQKAHRTTTTKKPTTATTKPATTPTTKEPTTPGSTTVTTAAPDPVPVDVPASATGAEVVSIALQYIGVPYVWAGASPNGFDCSGFVMYVYKQVGISLPHSSRMQAGYGTAVSPDSLQPGDLIFFYSPIHHVAIYIGDGKMVHAIGGGVQISTVWTRSLNCARRIIS
jgi:cell wall-associated NlpC family hydrolase